MRLQHDQGAGEEQVNETNITPERLAGLNDGTIRGTNWFDVVTRELAPMSQQNLNIRGGSEAVRYFASLGYLDQGTIWQSGDYGYERFNGSINLDIKVSDNLSSNIAMGWRREQRSGIDFTGSNELSFIAFAHPGFPATLPDGRLSMVNTNNPWSPVAATTREHAGYIDTDTDVFNAHMDLVYKNPRC